MFERRSSKYRYAKVSLFKSFLMKSMDSNYLLDRYVSKGVLRGRILIFFMLQFVILFNFSLLLPLHTVSAVCVLFLTSQFEHSAVLRVSI